MNLQFGSNLTINNSVDDINDIICYFDEIMALYDLIGKYKFVNISVNNNKHDISFDIVFKSYSDTMTIFNAVQRKQVSKYGHTYIPTVILINHTTLNIKLTDILI